MKLSIAIEKIPGGSMVLPMAIASVINTAIPGIRTIGLPATAIFSSSGTMTLIAIFLVFIGIQFRSNQLSFFLRRGGILVALKLIISIVFGVFLMKYAGLGGFWGISTLALVVTISSTNPGLYIALMESYGDDNDKANFTLLNLIVLPFIPICILEFSSGYGINYLSIISTLLLFFTGFLIGMLDDSIRSYSRNGIKLLLPFLGFCLGANINLAEAMNSVGVGIILFIVFIVVNNVPLVCADRLIFKQKGHVAAAICCVAGLSVAVPDLMAAIDVEYLPYVAAAKSQIAFAVVASTIVTPLLVKRLASR